MIFHYYIDPEIFRGTDGSDVSYINVLNFSRMISDNVLIETLQDDHLRGEFGESIKAISNPDIKKKVSQIFKRLAKRNRLIPTIEPDYTGTKSDLRCVIEQCQQSSLDAIITDQALGDLGFPIPEDRIFTSLEYHISHLEDNRARLVSEGRMCHSGDLNVEDFLKHNFALLLKYASSIEICDKLLGEKYGTRNWKDSIQRLLAYIECINESPSDCSVTFHTSCPGGQGKHELKRWMCEGLNKLEPRLRLYGHPEANVNFHHDRFIMTDRFSIMITCGFDFLNVRENCNRGTNLNYKLEKDIRESLNRAESEHPSIEM